MGGSVAIGALRMHDGCLTQAQVSYNYASTWGQYYPPTPSQTATPSTTASPSGTQLFSLSNTPSASATPSGTPCPTSFGFTHTLNTTSFTSSLNPTQYVRHCGYQLFATPNYPIGNPVSTMDATHLLRVGLDGTSNGISFESVNYQNHWMQVQSNGWLVYTTSSTVFANQGNRSAATFTLEVQANGNVRLLSHHPLYNGWAVGYSTNANTVCSTATYGPAINVSLQTTPTGLAPTAWTPTASTASFSIYSVNAVEYANTAPYQSERVVIESLGNQGKYVMISGGTTTGSLVVAAPTLSSFYIPTQVAGPDMLAPSYSFLLRPALGCPSVCTATGVSTFSLLGATGSNSVVFNYGGASYVGGIGSGYAAGDASMITFLATVNNVTGYVISSLNDYAAGNVWTISPGSGAIVSSPIPASGLSVSHLWRFFWEDGSGDLMTSGFPRVPGGEAGEPPCPSMSATPVPTTSRTPSFTPSVTASPSFTPSSSQTPSNTPSNSGSPTTTPIGTTSNSPSTTPSGSITATQTSSASNTASATLSPTSSVTSSPTATSTTLFATANLLVYLLASDFNATGDAVWPNRAAASGRRPSYGNGSFAPVSGAPFYNVIDGVPAVTFPTINGVRSQYSAASTAFPQTGDTIWSGSDWTIEFWVYSDGSLSTTGGYAPVVQWGARPGTTCDSAAVGIGASTTAGASTFSNCDSAWTSQPMLNDGTSSEPGFGFRPAPLEWHHVVFTYTGTASSPQLVFSQYLDGQLNAQKTSFSPAIRKDDIRIGSWTDQGATVSIAVLRVHNGALTAAQVAYNYAQFAPFAVVTVTSTKTSSSTRTPSMTITPSPSGTQIDSLSNTPSSSITASRTPTPTSTIQYQTTGGILIYLNAADYDAATGLWDNRATTGVVSFANGDFVPNVGTTSANLPTAGAAGQISNAAVIFNVTKGAPQYLVANPQYSAFSSIFGNTPWSLEVWFVAPGWTAYHNLAENPVFQWGPLPAATCGSAFFGAGNDPTYGAVSCTSVIARQLSCALILPNTTPRSRYAIRCLFCLNTPCRAGTTLVITHTSRPLLRRPTRLVATVRSVARGPTLR